MRVTITRQTPSLLFKKVVQNIIIPFLLPLTGEGRAGELLGVEAVVAFLRVVLPAGQRPGTPRVLALEGVPESALVLSINRERGNLSIMKLNYEGPPGLKVYDIFCAKGLFESPRYPLKMGGYGSLISKKK